ncbi:MAG TPA: hypothetical protein VFS08_09790 [Gemmatimonadaceae bacterium]|nr:hypothetical protein [Gemmatimonadaceae bacterium]
MTTDSLVAALRDAFGPALRAVVVYGAAAGDEPVAPADVHTLVLVDSLPLEALESAGAHIEAWVRGGGHPAPLVLTMAEWRSSVDVFPLEYADILDQHRALHGALPADGIEVDPEDLRLAVEREAMATLLQLRRGVLATGGDAERRVELLVASFPAFLTVFRGAVRVHGVRPSADAAGTCAELAFRTGVDVSPFVRVLEHRRGRQRITPGEVHAVLDGYLTSLERLVAHLDQVRPSPRAS